MKRNKSFLFIGSLLFASHAFAANLSFDFCAAESFNSEYRAKQVCPDICSGAIQKVFSTSGWQMSASQATQYKLQWNGNWNNYQTGCHNEGADVAVCSCDVMKA